MVGLVVERLIQSQLKPKAIADFVFVKATYIQQEFAGYLCFSRYPCVSFASVYRLIKELPKSENRHRWASTTTGWTLFVSRPSAAAAGESHRLRVQPKVCAVH